MSNETTKTGNAGLVKIAPVMFAFFVMGFVDLVGTATNYVKAEFDLANGTANLFTTMVFFWFLIFAVPTGMLMNKIGRRKTVLWSILVTLVAMALPIIAYVALSGTAHLVLIVISFAFLGIGNTLMQVSLNPLLTVFVKGDRLASTLTLGQFVKAFASLFAPYIAIWGATKLGMWWILFVIYLVVGIIGYVLLALDKIDEPTPDAGTTTIGRCFKLLFSDRIVFLCFLGIVAHAEPGRRHQRPGSAYPHRAHRRHLHRNRRHRYHGLLHRPYDRLLHRRYHALEDLQPRRHSGVRHHHDRFRRVLHHLLLHHLQPAGRLVLGGCGSGWLR